MKVQSSKLTLYDCLAEIARQVPNFGFGCSRIFTVLMMGLDMTTLIMGLLLCPLLVIIVTLLVNNVEESKLIDTLARRDHAEPVT